MTYSLDFHPDALKEWHKLDESIKGPFKKKLKERLEHPRVPKAHISGGTDLYKIKLASSGYRLIYKVIDDTITIYVLSAGKRQDNAAYKKALERDS
ncbi:type II toxin-antitoxin system RelE/ParE family toxin [Duganella sp. FT135W]|uniref:Type II toxin-antitoxin system RelE/ParE family toxin n=1 Tax=Duganella flavida TaxID=2692175 RepID=A0A6L8KGJ1_9BURK|nr:type II toxin-antitoxin system RelE/ParE family toxin [Duganella flavida]MYM23561.1 type II toxin-antitoxin system RelE/ParE family toxin [Duganella flavida]